MKIRTQLTWKNVIAEGIVFFLALVIVYFVCAHNRNNTFFKNLEQLAVSTAQLILHNDADLQAVKDLYLTDTDRLDLVEVAVFSSDFQTIQHDAINGDIVHETPEMIAEILEKGKTNFYVDKYQAVGVVYSFENEDYVVTAAAYDTNGYTYLAQLRRAMIGIWIVVLILLFIIEYILANGALRPIRGIVDEMDTITASEITRRLSVKHEEDELGELCATFNALLDRLKTSFDSQQQFVSNAAHELRTPLAAVIGQLDLSLQKERTEEEYRESIRNALADSFRMRELIDDLLNLAKADYHPEQIKMEELRLDELLLDVKSIMMKAYPQYNVELMFEEENDNDSLVTVRGNSYLLSIAFSNLIENNCKYSNDHCSFVQISYWEDLAVVRFSDTGKGISDEDKTHLFAPFYRGIEDSAVEGHGIGMALAQKVIRLHKGEITVNSEEGEGTTFIVELPHI